MKSPIFSKEKLLYFPQKSGIVPIFRKSPSSYISYFCEHTPCSMLKTHTQTFSLSNFLTLSLAISLFLTLTLSHSITLDMLNKFCFHLYAENSLFIAENCNACF